MKREREQMEKTGEREREGKARSCGDSLTREKNESLTGFPAENIKHSRNKPT